MANNLELKINSIELNSIEFSLSPEILDISKDEINLILNNNYFYNYNIYHINENNSEKYRIIPNKNFYKYDYLSIQIITESYISDVTKIFFCKYFSQSSDINFTLPTISNGKYKLILNAVNGYKFETTSVPITVSLPIDINSSDAILEGSGIYQINENIPIDIELIDINNNPVPNGNYLIEIEINEI
ncbi:MAG: hypothetical protein ACERKV_03650 [Clostridiaceae bacterium]